MNNKNAYEYYGYYGVFGCFNIAPFLKARAHARYPLGNAIAMESEELNAA